MRLKQQEIAIIKQLTSDFFGVKAEVYLFGSRVDDGKLGGDIDLLIRCNKNLEENVYGLRMKFLVELKNRIGEQKIDLLVDTGSMDGKLIESALERGLKL